MTFQTARVQRNILKIQSKSSTGNENLIGTGKAISSSRSQGRIRSMPSGNHKKCFLSLTFSTWPNYQPRGRHYLTSNHSENGPPTNKIWTLFQPSKGESKRKLSAPRRRGSFPDRYCNAILGQQPWGRHQETPVQAGTGNCWLFEDSF